MPTTADGPRTTASPAWTPFELAVVRGAGFSLRRLDAVVDERLWELASRAGSLARQRDRLARTLLDAAGRVPLPVEREARRRARAAVDGVRRGRPLDAALARWAADLADLPGWDAGWNETVGAHAAASGAFATRWPASVRASRRALAELCADERVREAVTLLAPDVVERSMRRVRDGIEGAGDGFVHDERKLAAFAQRLCAKAESNAFAGPVAYTRLAHAGDGATRIEFPRRSQRRGLLAWWAARELLLAAVAAEEPPRWPVPRRGPAAALATLPAEVERLVARVDGATAWADVAGGRASAGLVRRLDEAGAVATAPDLPTSEPVVLDALEEAGRAHRLAVLDGALPRLRRLADEFAVAGAAGKAERLAQAEQVLRDHGVGSVRRGAGQMYADRTVLYEEDYDAGRAITLSPSARRRLLQALEPTLELCAEAAVWASAQARTAAAEALRSLAAGRPRVPFLEAARSVPLAVPVDLRAAPCVQRLEKLVVERWDGHGASVALDPGELSRGRTPLPAGELLLASPDVLLAGTSRAGVEAGQFEVVVGEVHWGLQVLSNLAAFVADREALLRSARAWLRSVPGVPEAVNVALSQRYGKLCFLEAAPRTLELTGVAARGQATIDPATLSVDVATADVLDAGGRVLRLLLGDGDGATQPVFGPPSLSLPAIRLDRRCPRIVLGGAVLQRATWWFAAEEVPRGRGRDAYLDLARWWSAHGLPRRAYVRLPGEPKPLYVDAASPLLAELVLARGEVDGEVEVSEALPGRAQLWLQGTDGPCVAELRLTALRQTHGREA